MNSDLNPASDPSQENASNQGQPTPEASTTPETPPSNPTEITEIAESEKLANRQQPIPPPSEPMQYRAIGLVRGRYNASPEQFTQGTLVVADAEIQAVLLGRIMSLVKNHLDLEKEHLWVVYPRTKQDDDNLHLQIVGVWEPENLAKTQTLDTEESTDTTNNPTPSLEIEDGYFSVRGEVVYQSYDAKNLVVKIKQAPRSDTDKPKYFKLKLEGVLSTKAVGQFWDFQARRQENKLVIEKGESIAVLPKRPRPRGKFNSRPPYKGGKPFPRRNGEIQRPIRKQGDSSATPPRPSAPKPPTPKPIKRQKPE